MSLGGGAGQAHDCERVDPDFSERAAVSVTVEEEIPATPQRIFDIWEDAEAWPRWIDVIGKVTWTSDPPIGEGATRTVEMAGGIVADEEFIVWERPHHMAFRFNSMSRPLLDAFLEQYEVIDVGDDTSVVRWTISMTPRGPGRYAARAVAPAMSMVARRLLRSLATYARANP